MNKISDGRLLDDSDRMYVVPVVADGGDPAIGSTTDAAITTDTTGSISGKLRGLIKILADVWSSASHYLSVSLATRVAGEDLTNDRMRTEYSGSGTKITADTLVKTGAGHLHSLTFSPNDSAPTAGSIIVYDNTAESGTELFNVTFTTSWFAPFTVTLDVGFSAGLYIGFTTTNDVNVTPSYR